MSRLRHIPPPAQPAVAKYREFHRLDPKQIGAFPPSFAIPTHLYRAGTAKWVTYESSKVIPDTLKKPRKPVSYIHEHDAGVVTYVAVAGGPRRRRIPQVDYPRASVPEKFRNVAALTRLGYCLGFGFEDEDGTAHEAAGTPPLPDLYTVPDGSCLLVIQSRRTVVAMMWGGGLGVFARGIDG